MKKDADIIIIGAGISGLTAARILQAAGKSVLIIEATGHIGGRVKTDEVDGFLLDHGFQVLLTAYPEAKRLLNYAELDLRQFDPGALVLNNQGISKIGDPLRKPSMLLDTLFSNSGTLLDKMKILLLANHLRSKSIADIFSSKELTSMKYLEHRGFSKKIISHFFQPFFSGIFLEEQLSTSSRMFEFVFKMFSDGHAAVPAKGMGMIPRQLASNLSAQQIIFNQRAVDIDNAVVTTSTGKKYTATNVLIATEQSGMPKPYSHNFRDYHSVTNMYFSTSLPPYNEPLIALNSLENKLVNNMAILNQVSPDYSSNGQSLISLSLIGNHRHHTEQGLQSAVKKEMSHWFPEANRWKHLKTYHIDYALPNDDWVTDRLDEKKIRIHDNCYVCGDHLMNGSINSAMKSGRLAAETIIKATI